MYGGGQRVVLDLVNEAERVGDKAQVTWLGRNCHAVDQGNSGYIAYDGRYNRVDTLVGAAARLRRRLTRVRPALIHTHGWDADIIGWLACWGLDIPQVVHLHVMPNWLRSRSLKHRSRRALTKQVFAKGQTRVVAVSEAVSRHWAGHLALNDGMIRMIHNGVDVPHYRPPEAREKWAIAQRVIGVASRLTVSKGVDCLLESVGRLAHEGMRFRLHVAGSGGQERELLQRVRDLQIEDRVVFLGHVDDMPEFFRGIDIFVCPSYTEGMPITVLEAMASGKPVVASEVGGIPEAVRDAEEGLLVPPGDSGALSDALRRLLSEEDLRTQMGNNALKRAEERFSVERFYTEIRDVYRELLSWSERSSA